MYVDALSIAVAVIGAYAHETGHTPTWWDVSIWRLLNGGGWAVRASQSTIVLDKWMEIAA